MGKGRGPFKNNVYLIEDARKKVDLRLRCTICNKTYNQLVHWKTNLDKLRCPTCINPVDLVYPKDEK